MQIAKFSTLFLAAVLASPALWSAFVAHEMDTTTALLRFLIAVPVAAVILGVLHAITGGYSKQKPAKAEPLRAEALTGEPLQRRVND